MHKDGISAMRETVSLAMKLASFQAAAVTIAAFRLLCFHDFIIQGAGFAAVFLLMGFAMNLGLLALLLCAILSPHIFAALGNLIAGFVQVLWASEARVFAGRRGNGQKTIKTAFPVCAERREKRRIYLEAKSSKAKK